MKDLRKRPTLCRSKWWGKYSALWSPPVIVSAADDAQTARHFEIAEDPMGTAAAANRPKSV